MKKSISKRIRVTRRGKVIRRKMGVNHFRAKKSSTQLRRKGDVAVHAADEKKILAYANN